MVCRTTSIGSAATSYITQTTSLEEQQVLSLYHAIMREGQNAPAPTHRQQVLVTNQLMRDVQEAEGMTPARERSILSRIERSRNEEMTGQRHYATRRLRERAERVENTLSDLYSGTARSLGVTENEVREIVSSYRNDAASDRALHAEPEFVEGLRNDGTNRYPLDRQTTYALQMLANRVTEQENSSPTRSAVARTPVESSAIAEMGYDPTTGRCEVVMRSNPGVPYAYRMTPEEYENFREAPSLGSYYARNIRSNPSYRYSDTEEQNADNTTTQCASCGQFAGSGHACPPHGSEEEIRNTRRRARRAVRNTDTTENSDTLEQQEPVRLGGPTRNYSGVSGSFTTAPLGNVQRLTRSGENVNIRVLSTVDFVPSETQTGIVERVPHGFVRGNLNVVYNGRGQGYTAEPAATTGGDRLRCNCDEYQRNYDCVHIHQTIRDVNTRINQDRLRDNHSIGVAVQQVTEELTVEHEQSVAAQAVSRAEDTPSPVSYTDDVAAFQADYNAAKARAAAGENPIEYMTENATAGLGSRETGRAFGIELEFVFENMTYEQQNRARRNIGVQLHDANLTSTSQQQNYHAAMYRGYTEEHQGGWSFEADCTVSGEVISPIMYDTPETWENIQKVCDIIRENGGIPSMETGCHVHVSTGNYDHEVSNYNRLLGSMSENEDLIYRLSANPERGTHRGRQWCRPQTYPSAGYSSVDQAAWSNEGHEVGLNLGSVSGDSSDHIEFRSYDGTLDPAAIQTQIKLSLGLTEAAFRDADYEPGSHSPLGSRRRQNREEHGSTRRLTGEAWREDTAGYRTLADRIFRRPEDKAQLTSLFASTRWQRLR